MLNIGACSHPPCLSSLSTSLLYVGRGKSRKTTKGRRYLPVCRGRIVSENSRTKPTASSVQMEELLHGTPAGQGLTDTVLEALFVHRSIRVDRPLVFPLPAGRWIDPLVFARHLIAALVSEGNSQPLLFPCSPNSRVRSPSIPRPSVAIGRRRSVGTDVRTLPR